MGLINTSVLPGDNVSPDAIDTAAAEIRYVGSEVSTQGATVLSAWQRLAPSYQTPEAGQLLHAMDPVKTSAEDFGHDLAKAASALETFAAEARTIRAAVAAIRTEANAFLDSIKGGVHKTQVGAHGIPINETVSWNEDDATREQNNALLAKIDAQQVLLWAAERACANALYDLTGHAHIEAASQANPNGYGVDSIPADAKMPWGSAEDRPEHCGDKVVHAVGHFVWDGMAKGFVGGTLQGLGGLVGVNMTGWNPLDWSWSADTLEKSWTGLAKTAVGFSPLLVLGLHAMGGAPARFADESQQQAVAAVKGALAWDKWKSDPAAAAGEVLPGIASLFFGVGEAADGARAASLAAKAADDAGLSGKAADAAASAARMGRAAQLTDPLFLAAQAVKFVGKGAGLTVDAIRGLRSAAELTDEAKLGVAARDLELPNVAHDQISLDHPNGTSGHSEAPPAREHDVPTNEVGRSGDAIHQVSHPGAGASPSPHSAGHATAGHNTASSHGSATAAPPVQLSKGLEHQAWEDVNHGYGSGTHQLDASHPAVDLGKNSNKLGVYGEKLTRLDLEDRGYRIVADQARISIPGQVKYFKPDFIAVDPEGKLVLVESKMGPGAKFTPNQLDGYNAYSKGLNDLEGPTRNTNDALHRALDANGVKNFKVARVEVYRWNTEIVPDAGLLQRADVPVGAG